MERVHDTGGLAAVFGVQPRTIRAWARRGTIPATKVGRGWYVTEEGLRRRLQGSGDEQRPAPVEVG